MNRITLFLREDGLYKGWTLITPWTDDGDNKIIAETTLFEIGDARPYMGRMSFTPITYSAVSGVLGISAPFSGLGELTFNGMSLDLSAFDTDATVIIAPERLPAPVDFAATMVPDGENTLSLSGLILQFEVQWSRIPLEN